jgi:release factor glutamine methyltransferase
VLDIGCGTGCIGLYLKSKEESIDLELIDVSADAISLAKENAISLDVSCKFTQADMRELDSISCDVIVSNPPYIKSSDVLELDSSVRDYEPHLALDGGEDGLDYYRALLEFANKSLSEKGVILLEIGINQAHDVALIFTDYFKNIHIIKDFNDIERIVIARRD